MNSKVWPRVIVPFQGKLIYSIDDKNTQTVGLRFECNFCNLVFNKSDSFIFHFTNSHGEDCVSTLFREISKEKAQENEAESVEEEVILHVTDDSYEQVLETDHIEEFTAVGDNVEIIESVIQDVEEAINEVEEDPYIVEEDHNEEQEHIVFDEDSVQYEDAEQAEMVELTEMDEEENASQMNYAELEDASNSQSNLSVVEVDDIIIKEELEEFQSLDSELDVPTESAKGKATKRGRTRINTKMHTPILFELIEQLAKHPNLWDDNHENYRKRVPRSASYEAITNELRNMFPTASVPRSSVRSKIGTLRKLFHDAENSGAPIDPELYARLSFLRGRLKIEPRNIIRPNADGIYQCPHCNKQSKTRSNLSSHIRRLHLKDYTYKCHLCDKPFYSHFEMSVHVRTHTKEKPYYCEVCGKAFNTFSIMKMHQKQHTEQRDFKCPFCPKAYYRKDVFKEHIRSHDEVPQETCDICGKGFHTKRHLSKHKQRHKVAEENLYIPQASPTSSDNKLSI